MKRFVSWLLAALVTVALPLGTCLSSSAAGAVPDAPQGLQVLTQSVTGSGFTVVWQKPDLYDNITDYRVVVMQGATVVVDALASTNVSPATGYINQFYQLDNGHYGDVKDQLGATQKAAQQISMHTYNVTGLNPHTEYTVLVYAKNGTITSAAASTGVTTAAVSTVIDITAAPYNAVGDGALADDANNKPSTGTVNTAAIQAAINDCPAGGTVLVPAGHIFVTGPITLHSDMTLDVEGTLLASPDVDDYANPFDSYGPGNPDNTLVAQKSDPLISTVATDANGNTLSYRNIRIVGGGIVNGNGWATNLGKSKNSSSDPDSLAIDSGFAQYAVGKVDTSKTPPDDATLQKAAKNHLAYNQYAKYLSLYQTQNAAPTANSTLQANAYSTRSNLIVINDATNVYVGDGVTAANPSQHTIGFTNCQNAVVNGLIASTYDCNNGDGINFTNSTGLTVVNSVFNTGDDCVNFNAGVGLTGEQNPPTGNAWVFDNYFGRGHGMIAMGSNTAAWIQNILAEDNVCNGTAVGLRGKSQSGNGGGARNVVFRDSALANITDNDGSAFLLTDSYSAAAATANSNAAPDEPCFHDMLIQNCTVNGTKKSAILINGAVNGYDYNITFDNVAFGGTKDNTYGSTKYDYGSQISYARNCVFKNVVFYSALCDINTGSKLTNVWDSVTNSRDLVFTGSTPAPSATLMPGGWSAGSELTATGVTDTGATLAWAGSSSGATGYQIVDGQGNLLATVSDAGTVSTALTKLSPATSYTFSVVAVNAAGNGTTGPSVTVKTDPAPSGAAPETTAAGTANPKTADSSMPAAIPALTAFALTVLVAALRLPRKKKMQTR